MAWLLLLGIHLLQRGHNSVYEGVRKDGFSAAVARAAQLHGVHGNPPLRVLRAADWGGLRGVRRSRGPV